MGKMNQMGVLCELPDHTPKKSNGRISAKTFKRALDIDGGTCGHPTIDEWTESGKGSMLICRECAMCWSSGDDDS